MNFIASSFQVDAPLASPGGSRSGTGEIDTAGCPQDPIIVWYVDPIADNEELDSFLRSLGATPHQIEEAYREGRPVGLASELVLTHGAHLSPLDVAERGDIDVADVLNLWRTLGVNVADEHEVIFSERDAEFTIFAVRLRPVGSHGDELFRVVGSSLARVAEAA